MRLYLKHPEAPLLDHPKPGGHWQVVIIDDLGAGMIPSQVRQRLQEYTALELTDQVEIWITSSDMATINEFARLESFEDVYCWEDGKWVQLTETHPEDWLAHFALGDLYERGRVG